MYVLVLPKPLQIHNQSKPLQSHMGQRGHGTGGVCELGLGCAVRAGPVSITIVGALIG